MTDQGWPKGIDLDRSAAAVAQDSGDVLPPPPWVVRGASQGAVSSGSVSPFKTAGVEPKIFVKHDTDKPRADLLPPIALLEVAKVLGFGAKKYEAEGWRKVDKRRRYAGACMRHLLAWMGGETHDPESGLPHLAHLACSALFLLECELVGIGEDDRPIKKP